MKQKKIFIGPCEIAGYYSNLSKGFESIGLSSDFYTYQNHPFNYGGESEPDFLLHLIKSLYINRQKYNSLFIVIPTMLVLEIMKLLFFFKIIRKYDVLIFGFGQTLTRFTKFELIMYRIFKKKVICNILHGSEARPPYMDGTYQSKDGKVVPSIIKYKKISKTIEKNVSTISKYSDIVIAAPYNASQFVNKEFINHFQIGLPISWPKNSNQEEIYGKNSHSIKILHSPSHPAVKGTSIIITAINNLKNKGYDIDFIILENMPNSKVIEEIKKCDFIVDQLYSDTPLAGFSTEAAWFGKPAVVGGYGLENLKDYVNKNMWPPSKICHPDKIEETIEELIKDTKQRIELGVEARNFVREKWNITEVALKYKKIIEGNIPSGWMIDPKEIIYLEGVGQSSELTKKIVNQMIVNYGIDSLQLKNRSDIEHAYIEFISKD